jgi:hypothetical protein
MLRTRTLLVLLISSIVLCNVGVAFAFTSYSYACNSNQKYEFRVVSVSTVDSTGNSKYLKACVAGDENIFWTIRNAYPGEVVYLRFNVRNIGNRPLKMDGFRVSTTSNIAFNIVTTYSKQTFNPGETIKSEVKLTVVKAAMDTIGLFTIKINVLGV